MPIEKQPFRKYRLDEEGDKADTFTIRLNPQERANLEKAKKIICQERDSTAYKTLAEIGQNVLFDPSMMFILRKVFKNIANNRIQGVPMQEPEFSENVPQKTNEM